MSGRTPKRRQVADSVLSVITVVALQALVTRIPEHLLLIRSIGAATWHRRLRFTEMADRAGPLGRTAHRLARRTVIASVAVAVWVGQAALVAVHPGDAQLTFGGVLVSDARKVVAGIARLGHGTLQRAVVSFGAILLLSGRRAERTEVARIAVSSRVIELFTIAVHPGQARRHVVRASGAVVAFLTPITGRLGLRVTSRTVPTGSTGVGRLVVPIAGAVFTRGTRQAVQRRVSPGLGVERARWAWPVVGVWGADTAVMADRTHIAKVG